MENSSSLETHSNRRPLLAAGAILQNRYRIVRQLGSGGMGAVYEAVDQRLDATVAIKETFSVDDRLRRKFEQEARLLAQLHHPNLPRVSDYFTEEGRAFLVMQFIAGDDLAKIISQQPGPFPTNQVIAWADQLLDALVYLHTRDRQIVHRDIKPHNLKLTASGQIALLDFGLAKAHANDHSTTQSAQSVFGFTRRYSPLEQIQDEGTSPRSDIYALGATLYHLLTGIKPPDALARAAALANSKADPLRPAHEIHPAVGADIARILNKAMALHAGERFASANEFREALRGLGRKAFEPGEVQSSSRADKCIVRPATVLKSARPTDPFDSYSILKPEDEVFRLPRANRKPLVFAVAIATILIVITASYPAWLFDSFARLLESRNANVMRETNGATSIRRARNDVVATKPATIKPTPAAPSPEANHQNETAKRRARQSKSNASGVKPPPFSIAP
jgi:serine/threonine protein kinase